MLAFRSEDNARQWCAERVIPIRPFLGIQQIWQLALTWYENRLTIESRRPAAKEMREIFRDIGLEGPFWDPESDHWTLSC